MTKTTNKTKTVAKAKTAKAQAPKLIDATKGADVIVSSRAPNDKGQDKHMVQANDGRYTIIPVTRWVGALRELSAVGGSYSAFEAAWGKANVAKLAAGVSARTAPNAAKAVQDAAAKAKPEPAAKAAKLRTAAKKADRSAARQSSKEDRAYTVNPKALAEKPVREGTWTDVMVKTIMAHKSTHAAQAAMDAARGEHKGKKLDFKWAADVRGYITFKK